MKTILLIALAGMFTVSTGWAQPEGTITFQMDRLESVRDFWTMYYGQRPAYHERGEEDLQDSIARCMLAFIKYKMRRLDTAILYAGRDPGDETHLLCNIFPIDEGAHARMCEMIGMEYVGADPENHTLTCGVKATARIEAEPAAWIGGVR